MSVELKTYNSDRRLELGAAEAIRSPVYLDNWSTIRIGLQYSFDGTASNITSTPVLALGVCNGNTDVMVSATADHVVGWKNVNPTFTHTVGPPAYFNASSATMQVFKKVGAVVSTANMTNLVQNHNNATDRRAGLFLEIVKGSPNFTIGVSRINTTAAAQADLTDSEFLSIMELTLMSDIATVKAGYVWVTPVNLAVDETVDGVLNNIFVFWDRTTHKFSFNIRHRKVA